MTNVDYPPSQVVELRHRPPSAAALRELDALRRAVGQALDRQRRLGQCAEVWLNGELRRLPPEALPVWPAGGDGEDSSRPYRPAPLAQVVTA